MSRGTELALAYLDLIVWAQNQGDEWTVRDLILRGPPSWRKLTPGAARMRLVRLEEEASLVKRTGVLKRLPGISGRHPKMWMAWSLSEKNLKRRGGEHED